MLASYNDMRISSDLSMESMEGLGNERTETMATSTMPSTMESDVYTRHAVEVDATDPHGPQRIQQSIQFVIQQWERVQPIAPAVFLTKLLHQRGYDDLLANPIQAIEYKR